MAMSDISNMAHVAKFSHLTIPMLWFEIALDELPERLEKRFKLYLKILPMVEKIGLYGSFILGGILAIFAVFRVALRASQTMTGQKSRNIANNNSVYNPCEEKLIDLHTKNTQLTQDKGIIDDDDINFKTCNIIIRDQFELEEDEALSDIELKEAEEESSSSYSDQVRRIYKFNFHHRLLKIFN
jgi:scavenger receptor class B, member 1